MTVVARGIFSLIFIGIGVSALAHPIDGLWKFKAMHCSSAPEQNIELRPVPFSDFAPDMTLEFTTGAPGTQNGQSEQTVIPLDSTKALTTLSCTEPEARAVPGIFFQQEFHQKLTGSATNPLEGTLTGESLGVSSFTTPQAIAPGDCDTMLGFLTFLFGNSHIQGELARVYNYKINDRTLSLTYTDNLLGAQCDETEQTILVFERLNH